MKKIDLSRKILSHQLKKAIFLAFSEAKKYDSKVVNSKLLLYAILKTNNSLAVKNFSNIYKSPSGINSKISIFQSKLELQFNSKSVEMLKNYEVELNFTKTVRKLLFQIIRSLKGKKLTVITTLHVFNYLIQNKSLKNWLKDALI